MILLKDFCDLMWKIFRTLVCFWWLVELFVLGNLIYRSVWKLICLFFFVFGLFLFFWCWWCCLCRFLWMSWMCGGVIGLGIFFWWRKMLWKFDIWLKLMWFCGWWWIFGVGELILVVDELVMVRWWLNCVCLMLGIICWWWC